MAADQAHQNSAGATGPDEDDLIEQLDQLQEKRDELSEKLADMSQRLRELSHMEASVERDRAPPPGLGMPDQS